MKPNPISPQDSSTTKARNLWPYGILLAIFIGIILICISVYISVKHPVYDDRSFFRSIPTQIVRSISF